MSVADHLRGLRKDHGGDNNRDIENGADTEPADGHRFRVRELSASLGVQLGVFDALANGPNTSTIWRSGSGIKPIACRRLLMLLASLDLVEGEQGKFRNTDLAQSVLVAIGREPRGGREDRSLLSHVRVPSPTRYGNTVRAGSRRWAPLPKTRSGATSESVRLREFAELMNAISVPQGQLIAESYDFAPHKCIMDVAGGPGGQAIHIGLKHSHLRGIVTDLEPVCVVARENIAASGLQDRFSAVHADLIAGPYPLGLTSFCSGTSCTTGAMKPVDRFFATVRQRCPQGHPPHQRVGDGARPSGSNLAHMKDSSCR